MVFIYNAKELKLTFSIGSDTQYDRERWSNIVFCPCWKLLLHTMVHFTLLKESLNKHYMRTDTDSIQFSGAMSSYICATIWCQILSDNLLSSGHPCITYQNAEIKSGAIFSSMNIRAVANVFTAAWCTSELDWAWWNIGLINKSPTYIRNTMLQSFFYYLSTTQCRNTNVVHTQTDIQLLTNACWYTVVIKALALPMWLGRTASACKLHALDEQPNNAKNNHHIIAMSTIEDVLPGYIVGQACLQSQLNMLYTSLRFPEVPHCQQ